MYHARATLIAAGDAVVASTRRALMLRPAIIPLLVVVAISSNASAQTCAGGPVARQILGSGGPGINPERASAGYLLWVGP